MLFRNKTSAGFFEERYRKKTDPWNFAASEYEQGRFDTVVAALQHRRYRHAFEPGCSIGTLTEKLAPLCDALNASDFSETAVERARERCAGFPQVRIQCAALTEDTLLDNYDLVVFSEIGYYFRPHKWRAMVSKLAASMQSGATLLASHWTGHSEDHRQEADPVHEVLREEPLLQLEYEARHPGFRLDRFVRL